MKDDVEHGVLLLQDSISTYVQHVQSMSVYSHSRFDTTAQERARNQSGMSEEETGFTTLDLPFSYRSVCNEK